MLNILPPPSSSFSLAYSDIFSLPLLLPFLQRLPFSNSCFFLLFPPPILPPRSLSLYPFINPFPPLPPTLVYSIPSLFPPVLANFSSPFPPLPTLTFPSLPSSSPLSSSPPHPSSSPHFPLPSPPILS